MRKVISKDGTAIAFVRSGKGSPIILVGGALADRSADAPLAALLAQHFTVFNYDRRGRGESGDTAPYAVEREVEDLEALIIEAGVVRTTVHRRRQSSSTAGGLRGAAHRADIVGSPRRRGRVLHDEGSR